MPRNTASIATFPVGSGALAARATVLGGDGAAEARLRSALTARALVRCGQVHGDGILVPEGDASDGVSWLLGEGDGLATDRPSLALAIATADCIPLLLAEASGRVVAALHAGWRGLAAGIVARGVELCARRFAAPPESLFAWLGDGAGGCCYEVGPDVVNALTRVAPGATAGSWLLPARRRRPYVDLRALVRLQLCALGVPDERVTTGGECSICGPSLLPSYRREGRRAGRLLTAIALSAD